MKNDRFASGFLFKSFLYLFLALFQRVAEDLGLGFRDLQFGVKVLALVRNLELEARK